MFMATLIHRYCHNLIHMWPVLSHNKKYFGDQIPNEHKTKNKEKSNFVGIIVCCLLRDKKLRKNQNNYYV